MLFGPAEAVPLLQSALQNESSCVLQSRPLKQTLSTDESSRDLKVQPSKVNAQPESLIGRGREIGMRVYFGACGKIGLGCWLPLRRSVLVSLWPRGKSLRRWCGRCRIRGLRRGCAGLIRWIGMWPGLAGRAGRCCGRLMAASIGRSARCRMRTRMGERWIFVGCRLGMLRQRL